MPRTNKYKSSHNNNLLKNCTKNIFPKQDPKLELPEQSKSITSKIREIIDNHFGYVTDIVGNDEEKYWVLIEHLTAEQEKECGKSR
jgi:hypothetical protein